MPAVKKARNGIKTRGTVQSGSIGRLVNVKKGVMSPGVFVDPDIYGLEQERVFTRCWLFVAHESEIPGPGDFVPRAGVAFAELPISSLGIDNAFLSGIRCPPIREYGLRSFSTRLLRNRAREQETRLRLY